MHPIWFLLGCLPTRLFMAYLSTTLPISYLPYLSFVAMAIAIGFFYIYVTGSRATGMEVDGGTIWWNELRPIHGFLYGFFAYKLWKHQRDAYIPILIDVAIGLGAFTVKHVYM